ncbi:FAD-dependent oxidoreductase [Ideonella sp. A 288]|uniref:FAD-dependent oxidoreductase n=1 Tax=Ideonella sp. A 288 TaxID=1962181 RepID=UPI000B4A9975|nr:FAD/NAD(P)-binding oxidoreductase [Ideonella sp. A 288]
MERRHLLLAGGAGALASALAACGGGGDSAADTAESLAQPLDARKPAAPVTVAAAAPVGRVLVLGGGMAGASVAKYLRMWGNLDVTLVERNSAYTSNIMSSLVLTGQRTITSLRYTYDALRTKYGVKTVFDEVVAIDPIGVSVRLKSGTVLTADRIVLAPGIDFDPVPGLDNPDLMPHAWKAGPQTTLLAQQLAAMPAGGVVVMTIPKTPYRCPPGPYERACLLADWMKVRKPGSKLIVLDANPDIVTEVDNFSQAFYGLHANVIDYRKNVEVLGVDTASKTLFTSAGNVKGQVINLIPRQRAGALVSMAGLNNSADGRFAAVDVLSYASTAAPRVHVIGDASATTQPKAGHIANQEAKVCADAIIRLFGGGQPDPAPVTNSACYSTMTMTKASWLTAVFQYDPANRVMVPVASSSAASVGWNADSFSEMGTWFKALMADTYA